MTFIYDQLIKGATVVRPHQTSPEQLDIAIKDGRFVAFDANIDASLAKNVTDARGLLAFPGLVDAHMHTGIYAPLDKDARNESRAAAMGGVTSSLNYIRTGQYYLNKGGPYADFMPEVLSLSEGNYHVDYAYHVAPMSGSHIDEMPLLLERFGVSSFKIFMFYGSHGLHGCSHKQHEFLMIGQDERYDIAHFEAVMRGLKNLADARPDKRNALSLSLHCETAEIMTAYTKMVMRDGTLTGLPAYSASRPPHSEGLAIFIASYLANETDCVNINLLHLTSRKAVDAALKMSAVFPNINFRREVTIGHLLLDTESPNGIYAKVNPPIRPREDVEYLWNAVKNGHIDWICSDHACCSEELKTDKQNPNDVFMAKSGFGGTEYLLCGLLTEGRKRGLNLNRMAQLVCSAPAERYGLESKGHMKEGFDADVVLVDPNKTWVIDPKDSPSAQGYSPFSGMELTAQVKQTFLRGELIYKDGNVIGTPKGAYLKR
jgi:allantoinase